MTYGEISRDLIKIQKQRGINKPVKFFTQKYVEEKLNRSHDFVSFWWSGPPYEDAFTNFSKKTRPSKVETEEALDFLLEISSCQIPEIGSCRNVAKLLKIHHGVEISHEGVRLIRRKNGKKPWKPRKTFNMTPAQVDARFAWAQERENWTAADFGDYTYGDEFTFSIFSTPNRTTFVVWASSAAEVQENFPKIKLEQYLAKVKVTIWFSEKSMKFQILQPGESWKTVLF